MPLIRCSADQGGVAKMDNPALEDTIDNVSNLSFFQEPGFSIIL